MTAAPLTVSFPGASRPSLADVGGKAASLVRMIEAGLPVPRGAVLTTAFFTPWFDVLRETGAWAALVEAADDRRAAACADLKRRCADLALTDDQRRALDELRGRCDGDGVALLAVRSSSPEEDLASASFAGGYETRLGVRPDDLENAVRHCFASSLDERVLVYKRAHGFDMLSPRIAVIVQQQLDSEIAGVGFTLNPLTNDHDEAVVDANWGLGESVVAGLASPDHFVVHKVSGEIVERTLGAKQVSVWLDHDGGTVERTGHRSNEPTLDDAQIAEVTGALCRIEALYERPMDVEWAYAGGRLHVLQARPITSYVPLPPEMMTAPRERRRLYVDAALSKGMTINAPISPLGLDWMVRFVASFLRRFAGIDVTPAGGLIFAAGGRLYMNLSNAMWLASPQKLAETSRLNDALMADILANVDATRYRAPARPPWAGLRMLWLVPRLTWLMRGSLLGTVRVFLSPGRAHRLYRRDVEAVERELRDADFTLPLEEFLHAYMPPLVRATFNVTMPALLAAMVSANLMARGRSADREALERGYLGNVVVEMGIALHRLTRMLNRAELEDLPGLIDRVEQRRMPPEFLSAWDAFLEKYGWRGPREMDLASPRYADDPALALRQLWLMAVGEGSFDPEAGHRRQVEHRRAAVESLVRRAGPLRRALLRRLHVVVELFAGARDTPKYHMVLFSYALRRRALIEGHRLVREGRLDEPDHVFDLTLDDLEAAERDVALDLRAIRATRTRFLKVLETQVTEFPHVIDSRGRILRPAPRAEKPGELTGMAVSPGVATGPVKVLRDPDEKPVEKGDVLVAYTTDPGWTPLFVNAAAIVLEVGGVLQHGAVVAREYGKPCVAGVDRVLAKLHDGQRVEVDGTAGVIRLLDGGPSDG